MKNYQEAVESTLSTKVKRIKDLLPSCSCLKVERQSNFVSSSNKV